MKFVIHAHKLEAPRDVISFVRKHVLRSLRRLHDSPATELTLYVEDATPGKGGVDQACKMTFRLPGARTLRVESVKDDLHAAVLECGHRLRRLVQREVLKQRSSSRAPEHRPLGRTWREVATRRGVAPDGTPATL
jgi:ribosome-associated translation inhibitor RaiA